MRVQILSVGRLTRRGVVAQKAPFEVRVDDTLLDDEQVDTALQWLASRPDLHERAQCEIGLELTGAAERAFVDSIIERAQEDDDGE